MKLLVENGANVNVFNSDCSNDNNTALLVATSKGNYWKVLQAVCRSFNQRYHFTTFFIGYDKVAELLIQKGADVNFAGLYGTSLIWAARNGKKYSFTYSISDGIIVQIKYLSYHLMLKCINMLWSRNIFVHSVFI